MNVLDENIMESQRQLLRGWPIPVRQIGPELGHKGMQDEENLPLPAYFAPANPIHTRLGFL